MIIVSHYKGDDTDDKMCDDNCDDEGDNGNNYDYYDEMKI